MKTVAFYQPFMNERGTCVAMYDYAHYNQTLLGNKSVFIYDSLDSRNESKGLARIRDNFPLFDIRCSDHPVSGNAAQRSQKIDEAIEASKTTHIYMCKSGYNDGVIPTKAKSLVHIMGMVDPSHKHGDVWAYVSYFSNNACGGGKEVVLPYMVTLPDENGNLRARLGIPSDAVVFGRYGGMDTFDPWGNAVIEHALRIKPNIYFLFMNTPVAISHPRVIYLESTVDPIEKTQFINTCDAMLHVRGNGETFGMACAEFSIRNKPVITDFRSPERNHIDILGIAGHYYNSPESLLNVLLQFVPHPELDWNCYRDYTPEKIMKIFDEVFLQ